MPLNLCRVLCLAACILAGCGDPQQRSLAELQERGYSLSVSEFHRAAEAGDEAALDAFLRAGTNIDVPAATGETALLQAIRGKQTSTAKWLADHGAKLTTDGSESESTLLLATRASSPDLIQLVAADHDEEQVTAALLEAAQIGHSETLRALLGSPAFRDPESRIDCSPAFLIAARNGNIECIDLLLQAGADPDTCDAARQWTALHFAVKNDQKAAAHLLLRNGASRLALTGDAKTVWQLGELSPAMAQLLAEPEETFVKLPSIREVEILGRLSLIRTHLTPLPLSFTALDGRAAVLQQPDDEQELHVRPGELVANTHWRLQTIVTESAFMPTWALPHVVLTDTTTDHRHHLLIRNRLSLTPPVSATLQIVGIGTCYHAQVGDTFQLAGQKQCISAITRRRLVLKSASGASATLLLAP